MGRNKNKNKQQRMKKKNEKLLTALMPTSTAASTQASAVTTATTVGDATDNDNGTTETTTAMACYHGSTEVHFAKGSGYQMVVDEWMFVFNGDGTAESHNWKQTFATKHIIVLKDPDFSKYVFASTTDMFRKTFRSEKYSPSLKWKLKQILNLAIDSKYWYTSLFYSDAEKREKFIRDINTDRGIINVLHRETSPFCNCMKPLKSEAKKMEKVGNCYGCRKEFPKALLKRCIRCDRVQYCSKECQKKNWSFHKKYCKNNNNKVPIKSEE